MNRGTRLGISSRQSERSTGRSQLDPTELKRDYNFLSGKLHGDITFSRGSNATLVGSDGLIKYAPHNLLPRSNEFTHSDWNNPTKMTANRAISPTGENNASEITTESAIYDSVGNVGGNITISIHAKKNTATHFVLSGGYPTANRVIFDLETGVACQVVGVAKHTSESLGNGWFRFSVSVPSSSTDYIQFSGRSSCAYASNNRVVGVYVYGAQIERTFDLNSGPQAYIETTGSAVHGARFDYDKDGNSKGLLIEEARTNLIVYSQNFSHSEWILSSSTIATSGEIDPSGGTGAYKLTLNASDSGARIRDGWTSTAGEHTFSVYVKKGTASDIRVGFNDEGTRAVTLDFNIDTGQIITSSNANNTSIQDCGNGWYRVSVTGTIDASGGDTVYLRGFGTNSNTSSGDYLHIFGAQLEQGSFPTSLIPTYGATATRSGDSAVISGTNFSRFHKDAKGGSWIVEADDLADQGSTSDQAAVIHVSEAGNNFLGLGKGFGGGTLNRPAIWYKDGASGGDMIYNSNFGNSAQTIDKNAAYKLGVALDVDNASWIMNGHNLGVSQKDTSVPSLYSPTSVALGTKSSYEYSGHIRRVRYFNKRISDAKLVKETNTEFLLNKNQHVKAAHSLRQLKEENTNSPVTRIRREYDSFEADYTANQVTNGELEADFQSEKQKTLPLNISCEAEEMIVGGDFTDIVTNGDFAASAGWTALGSASIGSGVATIDGTSQTSSIYQNALVNGKTYTLTFTVSSDNGTGNREVVNNDGGTIHNITGNGTFTVNFTHSSASGNLFFKARNGGSFVVDNVSVVEGSWGNTTGHFRITGNQFEKFGGTGSENSAFTQTIPVRKGKTYKVEYDVIHTSGNNYSNVYINPGGGYITIGQLYGSGHVSAEFTSNTTGNLLMQFYGIGDFRGFWDNISVKEVVNSNSATGFSTRLINADYKGKPLMRIRRQDNTEAELYADDNDEISLTSTIKGSSQNLLAYSEDFGSLQAVPTTLKGGQADPFGGNNAYEIIGNATHATATVESGTSTLSIYAKKGTADFLVIRTMNWDSGSLARTWFNLSTGAVGSTDGGTAHVGATIEAVTGYEGWYRCAVTFKTTSDLGGTSEFYSAETDSGAESSSKSIIAFGMQLEKTLYASSGSNILYNGDFELDTAWNDFGSPVTQNQSTEIVYNGTYSRKVVSSANGKGIQSAQTATSINITSGNKYRVSAWIYAVDGGGDAGVKSGIGNTDQGVFTNRPVTEGQWTNITYDAIGTASGYVSSYMSFFTNGDTTTFYVDDVTVTELPKESPSTYSQTPVIVSSHHSTTATTLGEFSGNENLIPYSEDTSEWNNIGGANVNLTSGLADPFGGTNAFSIQSTTASFLNNLNTKTAAVIEPNSTNTYSFFVKKETSKTNFGGVAINITGGTTKIGYIIIDEVNGTAVNTTDSTINTPTISVTEPITGWYRVAITVEDTHSNTNAFMIFYSGLSSNGTTLSAVTGSPRTIFGAQLNTGSTLKTYQATTGTALTGDCHLSVWYCQNGNSDFVNDTASEQPRIVMGSELVTDSGGKASVYFDGGDTLDNNTLAGNNRLDSYTIQDTSDSTYVIPSSATSGSHYGIYANNDTSSSAGSHAGSASFGTPNIYRNGAVFSTSTLNDVHDGLTGKSNLLTMEGASTSVWTSFTVGHYFNNSAPSFNFTGKISEMVFFPNMDSSPKRFNIEQNMLNHFDIGLMDIDFEGVSATDMSNNTIIGPSGNSTIGSVALSGETSNPISGTNSLKLSITGGNNNTYPRIYTTANGSMPEDAQIGTKYRVTFDTKLVSGSATLAGLGFADGGNKEKGFLNTNSTSDNVVLSGTQSHSFENTITELTGTVSARNDLFWSWRGTEGDSVVLIDNIKIKKIGFTGFVTTLYDQTGNNCHALQSTAAYQPQLVSGGDLIKSGNHPAWEHVTASNMLMEGKIQAAHLDAWFVAEPDSADTHYLYPANYASTGDHGFVAQDTSSTNALLADYGNPTLYANGTSLGTTGASLTRDGIHTSLSGRKLVHHQGADTADWAKLQMGYFGSTSDSTFNFQGKFSEWIWYDSDQSSNKTGIESNINSHYNIYS